MKHLAIIKEYIDAKADYDRAELAPRTGHAFTVSTSLTPGAERINSRYLAAEEALNEAVEADESAVPE